MYSSIATKATKQKAQPNLNGRTKVSNPILASELTFAQTMHPSLLELKNLEAGKRDQILLRDINWTIRAGEHWHITGPMGAGKSTLLQTILGKSRVFSGKVFYSYLSNPASISERRKTMAFVSFTDRGKLFNSVNAVHYYQQRYNAFDSDGHLTVSEYLTDGGFTLTDADHLNLIKKFGLETLLDTERIKLSSGQTRKLILCKAFLKKPRILMLDNPHIGLDDDSREVFNNLVDQMVHHYDTSVILSGQLRSLPRCISHQLFLSKGSVKAQGTLDGRSQRTVKTDLDIKQKYALDKIKYHFLVKQSTPSNLPVLKMRNVTICYGGREVIAPINWQVNHGEKWCLIGGNGSGKSTLVGLIYGDHPQAYGKDISLFGRRRGQGESIWDIKQKMGFTSPELHAFFPQELNAKEVILSGFSDTLYPPKTNAKQQELCSIFLSYFGKPELIEKNWSHMSSGEQRLVLFIRALIKAPPLLLLDEPFQGLDPHQIDLCKKLLNDVLTENHTLIFITHFRDEIPLAVTRELNLGSA